MESIKVSLFDIFAYALPGSFILLGIIVLTDGSFISVNYLPTLLGSLNFGLIILAVLMAYVLGFAIDSPASWYYYLICCKIGTDPKNDSRKQFNISREKEKILLQLVRDKCPEINAMLQTWKLMKTMSHNLAFTFLILTIILLAKISFFSVKSSTEWFLLSGGCLIISLVLAQRSKVFDLWFYQDLFNTGVALKLVDTDDQSKEAKAL